MFCTGLSAHLIVGNKLPFWLYKKVIFSYLSICFGIEQVGHLPYLDLPEPWIMGTNMCYPNGLNNQNFTVRFKQ